MKLKDKIKETKENGVYFECELLGDGTDDNLFRPYVFEHYKAYYHFDTSEIDYTNKTCKIWVNKKRTAKQIINDMKKDSKLKKEKETGD